MKELYPVNQAYSFTHFPVNVLGCTPKIGQHTGLAILITGYSCLGRNNTISETTNRRRTMVNVVQYSLVKNQCTVYLGSDTTATFRHIRIKTVLKAN